MARAKKQTKAKAKAKTTAKAKKVKTIIIKVGDVFDASQYARDVQNCVHGYEVLPFKTTRPLTLAEHETAEAEAHEHLTNRVEGGPPEGIPSLTEERGYYDKPGEDANNAQVSSFDLVAWGQDVVMDAAAYEKIANDLQAFRRAAVEAERVSCNQEMDELRIAEAA
jgi:hypothetical protein